MTREEIKVECLKLINGDTQFPNTEVLIREASKLYQWVIKTGPKEDRKTAEQFSMFNAQADMASKDPEESVKLGGDDPYEEETEASILTARLKKPANRKQSPAKKKANVKAKK